MFYDKDLNSISIVSSEKTEPSIVDLMEGFLKENNKTGYLTFQVTQDSPLFGRLPVKDAKITVSKELGSNYFISRILVSDSDGKTEKIPLPTVSADLSLSPGNGRTYATYNVSVEAPNFTTEEIYDIPIFEGIISIQPVNLEADIKV